MLRCRTTSDGGPTQKGTALKPAGVSGLCGVSRQNLEAPHVLLPRRQGKIKPVPGGQMVHVGWGEKGPRGEIDTAGPYQTKAAAPTAARRRRQLSRTWLPLHTG